MNKYCPLSFTRPEGAVPCIGGCAWYDKVNQRCEIYNISAELADIDEVVRYAITEKGLEYLKGARQV